MTTIGIHEAKHRLLHYLTCAAAGEEILITRRGKPIARLIPLADPTQPRKLGLGAGRFQMPEDFDAMAQSEMVDMFNPEPSSS
ncbi:type II toxin-antitoxin system Phd/YefM family antitoxin [Acidithiobacillus caldus]|uniref:Antitoxin n=1 Tax=Acidithiobacillus caldus TaxID=33059 RepID=A0A1E7YKG3_9PROT|nr:type II toxin-antitoxin system prevent-host-death family antitoxin [Acidithiobacillus caldus]OFC30239.1 antitoxin [Acidithiobacillus caldus]OFC30633.1 antitoxin [Acidithiobacillus caldus]OFC36197.1 antitoxin [Acidithiobacillus caldus]